MKKAVKMVNSMKPLPKFMFVGGDMVNAYPSQ